MLSALLPCLSERQTYPAGAIIIRIKNADQFIHFGWRKALHCSNAMRLFAEMRGWKHLEVPFSSRRDSCGNASKGASGSLCIRMIKHLRELPDTMLESSGLSRFSAWTKHNAANRISSTTGAAIRNHKCSKCISTGNIFSTGVHCLNAFAVGKLRFINGQRPEIPQAINPRPELPSISLKFVAGTISISPKQLIEREECRDKNSVDQNLAPIWVVHKLLCGEIWKASKTSFSTRKLQQIGQQSYRMLL